VRRAFPAAACAIAGILWAAGAVPAQDPRSSDKPAMRVVTPGAFDLPAGSTRLEAGVDGALPGDTVDFFVDGRKVGTATTAPWVVTWDAGDVLRAHVVTAVLVRDDREIASARVRTRDPGFTETAEVRAVSLAPIVTDRSGEYIYGLKRGDFSVMDDGVRQEIETFEAADSPLSAILVLDTSASMRPKLEDATRAARAFVRALKADDEVGLFTFNTGVVGSVDLTRNRAPVDAAIAAVQPAGETALYDAVAAALRRLKPVKRRKAVVVFTDGEDNRSRLSVAQVVEMARASEVAIYAIAEGKDASTTVMTFLDRLAAQTGGRSYFIGHIRKLSEAFDGIVRELRSSYFLTYTPRPAGKPGTWHHLEVRVSRADAVVRAKKEYLVE
jgi:Ca-activated chloride channel family protein